MLVQLRQLPYEVKFWYHNHSSLASSYYHRLQTWYPKQETNLWYLPLPFFFRILNWNDFRLKKRGVAIAPHIDDCKTTVDRFVSCSVK